METRAMTRQSLTDDEYLSLLGICQWVFNSNIHFLIEMIDEEHHGNSTESWYELADLMAGQLKDHKNLVVGILSHDVYNLFSELVTMRNAIIHSFPTGENPDGYYVAFYKDKKTNEQVAIDKKYLKEFIKKNEALSLQIYSARG